jgi:hypothetical protein
MSRTADIDLVFARAVTVDAVVRALAGEGWSLQEPLGISYMVNNDDLFNWQSASTDQAAEVLTLVDSPDNIDYHVGVCIYHPTAETGGQLLFHAGRSHCSFIPTIDRRRVFDCWVFGLSRLADAASCHRCGSSGSVTAVFPVQLRFSSALRCAGVPGLVLVGCRRSWSSRTPGPSRALGVREGRVLV